MFTIPGEEMASIVNPAAGLVSVPSNHNTKLVTKHPAFSSLSSSSFCKPSIKLCSRAYYFSKVDRSRAIVRASSETTMATEKLGIKIVKNPPEPKLTDLGVRSWPKWGCEPSKFPWTYSSKETCYLLKGKVKVYPEESQEAVEIGAGDLVEFPKGMNCTWDVSETVDKHYKFD